MHLDDERLQRLIDDELSVSERGAALEHLASCAECRQAKQEAEEEESRTGALLRELDEPAPAVRLEQPVFGRAAMPMRWAAVAALLVVLVGAAFAIPGSVVSRWIRQLTAQLRHDTPALPSPPAASAGIAITPGSRTVIDFRSGQAAGEARVRITEDAQLVIRAPNGAATFDSDIDHVTVNNHGEASFEIDVPRTAPWIEIRVGAVPRFRKEGGRITLGDAVEGDGYRVPLGPR